MDTASSAWPATIDEPPPTAREASRPVSPTARSAAIIASLLVHGLVVAVSLAPGSVVVPPEPLTVELVSEAGGSGGFGRGTWASGGETGQPNAAGRSDTPDQPADEAVDSARAVHPAHEHPDPDTAPIEQPEALPPTAAVRPAQPLLQAPKKKLRAAREPKQEAPSVQVRHETVAADASAAIDRKPAQGDGAQEAGQAEDGGGGGPSGSSGSGGGPGYRIGSAANPFPPYPPAARRRGIEGTVVLRVAVLADGSPRSVEIARSSGSGLLDEAARDTIARWRFRPATRSGEAVEGKATVPVRFTLLDR